MTQCDIVSSTNILKVKLFYLNLFYFDFLVYVFIIGLIYLTYVSMFRKLCEGDFNYSSVRSNSIFKLNVLNFDIYTLGVNVKWILCMSCLWDLLVLLYFFGFNDRELCACQKYIWSIGMNVIMLLFFYFFFVE